MVIYPIIILPYGLSSGTCFSLFANTSISDIAPSRPAYISSINIIWEAAESVGVTPVVSPTVPIAEATSNMQSRIDIPSMEQISITEDIARNRYTAAVVCA